VSSRIERVRNWLVITAMTMLLVVAGFFGYARYRVRKAVRELPQKLGVEVQQSTEGFTYSHSQGGRTIFIIHAARAIRYKGETGKAELKDVSIVVYGRDANRFDQIYGSDFEYDPQSGDVVAKGEVNIDLEADTQGPVRPDQALPQELKNPIHLKTSGVIFNQKTGIASTPRHIEFRVPQGNGSAVGAVYDSKARRATLKSQVELQTIGSQPTKVNAHWAEFSQQPHEVNLETAIVHQGPRTVSADHALIALRDDNTVQSVHANGNVNSESTGKLPAQVHAAEADFKVAPANILESGVVRGDVNFSVAGDSPLKGSAGQVLLTFAPGNQIKLAQLREAVQLDQLPGKNPKGQLLSFSGDALDLKLKEGDQLQSAETSRAAQIVINGAQQPGAPATQSSSNTRTVVTARKFEALFADDNQIKSLHGAPDAKIVSTTEGQAQRTSTSQDLLVHFKANDIESILQQGDVEMQDDQRSGNAEQARYVPQSDTLTLNNNVRIRDKVNNTTISSDNALINQRTGELTAKGQVKTTYLNLKPQPNGAMLGSSDPIHVTSSEMVAEKATGISRYTGESRLWQGANVIQSQVLVFDRNQRSLVATAPGGGTRQVSCIFVQTDKSGKQSPIDVTAGKLTYTDSDRKARFEVKVVAKGQDGTLKADRIDVFLRPAVSEAAPGNTQASQIDKMDARGHVHLEQPTRRGDGEHLLYTASDGKFVLTGRPGNPPSIFDAEQGTVTGDSLTFFSRDDRVLVGSNQAHTASQTRVKK
jgi:lipopolysaccharide export system protein LptA